MKSMTAYGRAVVEAPFGKWTVEISSVNRKNAEIQAYLPRHLLKEEFTLRKWMSSHVQRGQVSLRAHLQKAQEAFVDTNLLRLRKIKRSWDQIALELGYPPAQVVDLKFLLEQLSIVSEDSVDSSEEQVLKQAFEQALEAWEAMRIHEGEVLRKDIESHLALVRSHLEKVEALLPRAVEALQAKLRAKLGEISQDVEVNEERLAREVMLATEKWDVTEEVTRMGSHIGQFYSLITEKKGKGALGKSLEFLIQELNREINTLGAKVSDLSVIQVVLKMKNEMEKIREQVQNIE